MSVAGGWRWLRRTGDRLAIYLPVILMGLLAAGTYWLARNTPTLLGGADAERPVSHDPDYFMRGFSVKTFDAGGRLKSEVFGTEARHYPDTDTLEIDMARIRSYGEDGALTVATAKRALSNADGSEVQLMGDAVVVRETPPGTTTPRLEYRGEFLHAFMDTERVRSHKPVTLIRGTDVFTADSMEYDNLDAIMVLRGRVRGVLQPRAPATAAPTAAPRTAP